MAVAVRCRGTYAISEAMEHMAGGYGLSLTPGVVLGFQNLPECISRAIRMVEEQEVLLDDQDILKAVGLFLHNLSLAMAYLAFRRKGLRSKRMEQDISVDSEAVASQLSFPMCPME